MQETILDVQQLSIQYEGILDATVVNSVSFSLKKGETLGILGESGSGKTSLALALCGLLPKAKISGTAHFFSKNKKVDLLNPPKDSQIRGRGLAMVMQDATSSLNPAQTCGQQIVEAIVYHFPEKKATARSIAFGLLEKCQLEDVERVFFSFPHQLSGGQKQRVLICISLACEPELLLLDEPTSALDVGIKNEILEVLQALQISEDLTFILISHDLDSLRQLADTVILLKKGDLIEYDTKTNFFQNPQTAYAKGLIQIQPNPNQRFDRLPELSNFESKNEVLPKPISEETIKLSDAKLYVKAPILQLVKANLSFLKAKENFFSKKHRIPILHDFDFDLYSGEIIGVVGASGSGKTSFGRVIAGLQALDSGSIVWPSFPLQKPKIQMVFQNPFTSLNPKMRIDAMLSEAIEAGGERNKSAITKRTEHLLALGKMSEDSLMKYPVAFSGGQQQRLSILRALASKPDILICDEIVSSLDVSIQASILNLLLDIRDKEGLSCVFISHDEAVVLQIANRVMHFPQTIV